MEREERGDEAIVAGGSNINISCDYLNIKDRICTFIDIEGERPSYSKDCKCAGCVNDLVEMRHNHIFKERDFNHMGVEDKVRMAHAIKDEHKRVVEALKTERRVAYRISRLMVGRELKMIELKREVNALLEELGREKKYYW